MVCNDKKSEYGELSEGVQITIETLENIPEDLLVDFFNNIILSNQPIDIKNIWINTIKKHFNL